MTLLRYLLPGFFSVAILSCGVSDDTPPAGQGQSNKSVTPSNQLFTLDDFGAIGFKIAKEYNVDGLTAATGAWFGFWRPEGSDAKEFEIRFYASHEDAALYGTSFADEATGEDAVLEEEDVTWKEGIKDRKYFFAGPIGSHGSGSVQPKYGDYAIYGNMVLLCEGANATHSLERCSSLIGALRSEGSK